MKDYQNRSTLTSFLSRGVLLLVLAFGFNVLTGCDTHGPALDEGKAIKTEADGSFAGEDGSSGFAPPQNAITFFASVAERQDDEALVKGYANQEFKEGDVLDVRADGKQFYGEVKNILTMDEDGEKFEATAELDVINY